MTTCPPPHVLEALSHDELPPDEAAAVLSHAGACAACTETLRELSDPGSLAELFERRNDPTPEPQFAPAPAALPPAPPRAPESPFGRWGKYLLVGVAGAVGLVIALGTKVGRQAAAVRDAEARAAAADESVLRSAAAAELNDARLALARGVAALDDGDPAGEAAVAAANARLPAAEQYQGVWTGLPRPGHIGYHPRLAVLTPNGKRLLTAAADPRVVVWDATNGKAQAACVLKVASGGRFEALAVSPDGRYAAAGSSDGRVWVWELPEKGEAAPAARAIEVGGGQPVWVVAFTGATFPADPPVLWAAGADGVPAVRSYVPSSAERKTGATPPVDLDRESGPGLRAGPVRRGRPVVAAGADPAGRLVFTADPDGTFRYWDAATRLPLGRPAATPPAVPR